MLRKNLTRRNRLESGEMVQTVIFVAVFAIVALLGMNALHGTIQGKAEAVASKLSENPSTKIEEYTDGFPGEVKIKQNNSSERQTTGAKLTSDEYYAAYSAINSKPNNAVAKQVEEFRIQNTGVVGKELRISNLSNPNQRNTLDPEYDTFLVTHDGLGSLDLVIEYDDPEYSSRVNVSYLANNPQKEGL